VTTNYLPYGKVK